MSNETPEQIAERVIRITPRESQDTLQRQNFIGPLALYFDRIKTNIAEAIRKERVVRVPKNSYVDQAINCMNNLCQHEIDGECDAYLNKSTAFEETVSKLKKLNEGKTFVEGK